MHIAFIGGGTGLADIVPYLSERDHTVTCIVGTWDSGGSTGILRSRLHIPAIGDLRKVADHLSGNLFLEERVNGHPLGNIILAFQTQHLGIEQGSVRYAEMLGIPSCVLPVTAAATDLLWQTASGKRYRGEHLLDSPPPEARRERVTQVTLNGKPSLTPAAAAAIRSCDILCMGPGSVLGSLLPHLSVTGFTEAWNSSRAKKVLALPGTREYGYHTDTPQELAERFSALKLGTLLLPAGNVWTGKELLTKLTRT